MGSSAASVKKRAAFTQQSALYEAAGARSLSRPHHHHSASWLQGVQKPHGSGSDTGRRGHSALHSARHHLRPAGHPPRPPPAASLPPYRGQPAPVPPPTPGQHGLNAAPPPKLSGAATGSRRAEARPRSPAGSCCCHGDYAKAV